MLVRWNHDLKRGSHDKGTYTYYVITFWAFLDPLPPSIIKGYHLADPPPANDNIILGQSLLVRYSDPSQELGL